MVAFSELALAGLARATESDDQRNALRHAINLHLSHPNAVSKSRRLPHASGIEMYMFSLWRVRITWELTPEDVVQVWSISVLRNQQA